MRLPALIFGVAALLAVPALLLAQEAGKDTPSPGATKAVEESTAAAKGAKVPPKAESKKVDAKTIKAVHAKAKPKSPPARDLFGAFTTPAPLSPRSIGFYAKGCVAGAMALPVDGPAWQAMRLSRNRNWGHPNLIALVRKLATDAKANDGWPGLLVGDMSQPRGGPMTSGHASHQVGLDADVWFTPMPDRTLTAKEREEISATSMLSDDSQSVNPKVWTEAHVKLLKRAASYPEVERVFVHPAIKKAICDASKDEKERGWLTKIRAYWGHYYHFHIRIACPKGSTGCEGQPPVNHTDDGCGAELTQWLKRVKPSPQPPQAEPKTPSTPAPGKAPLTLEQMPEACKAVLASGDVPQSVKEALAPPKKAEPAPAVAPKAVVPAVKKAEPAPKAIVPPAPTPATPPAKKASLPD